ncbi:unnamed protein product [Lactuca saligna]|uniref:Uncharacterized protein n=1 Tax=Lactuca saligna TaxID=75948 RepID=A0AA36EJC5_LACSI|nr:unnamed protein product [Lactuca saligna]
MLPRSIMWCKGRESNGVFKDEDVKLMADKLIEQEKKIKKGQVNVEPGTNAMTLVFGKEKGGFLKGVSTGVTYNRYFNVPHNKGSSKEEIKVNEQDQTLKLVLAHLYAKGVDFQNLSHTVGISCDNIVESSETTPASLKTKQPSELVTPVIGKPTKKQVQTNSATATPDTQLISMKYALVPIKCSLPHPYKRNIVALVVMKQAFPPHKTGEFTLVEDAYKSFVPSPKYLVQTESQCRFHGMTPRNNTHPTNISQLHQERERERSNRILHDLPPSRTKHTVRAPNTLRAAIYAINNSQHTVQISNHCR